MGAPTFLDIRPNVGPTGGRRVLRIRGTNFQLLPAVPSAGPAPAVNPSVRVLFGDVESPNVAVLNSKTLNVELPPSDFALTGEPGAVSLTIQNIDQSGALIGSETVTVPAAFTYARPQLNTNEATESVLARIVRTLITALRREILNNVELSVHVDFDDTPDSADITMLAQLPGLVLIGPRLKENRFYSINQARQVQNADGTYQERVPYTVDLEFTIIGADDSDVRLFNLQTQTMAFFKRHTSLFVLRDPAVPGVFVDYEMDLTDMPAVGGVPNTSSIRAFSGTFLVRGLDIDDEDMNQLQIFAVEDVQVGTGPKLDLEEIPPTE